LLSVDVDIIDDTVSTHLIRKAVGATSVSRCRVCIVTYLRLAGVDIDDVVATPFIRRAVGAASVAIHSIAVITHFTRLLESVPAFGRLAKLGAVIVVVFIPIVTVFVCLLLPVTTGRRSALC